MEETKSGLFMTKHSCKMEESVVPSINTLSFLSSIFRHRCINLKDFLINPMIKAGLVPKENSAGQLNS
jgi:hypothetical protein